MFILYIKGTKCPPEDVDSAMFTVIFNLVTNVRLP